MNTIEDLIAFLSWAVQYRAWYQNELVGRALRADARALDVQVEPGGDFPREDFPRGRILVRRVDGRTLTISGRHGNYPLDGGGTAPEGILAVDSFGDIVERAEQDVTNRRDVVALANDWLAA